MKPAAMAILAVLIFPSVSEARCGRWRYGVSYTLNSYNWPANGGCFSCHKAKTEAYNWQKAITTIEAQKVETEAFLTALATISPQQGGQVQAFGVPGYGAASVSGSYSSYPVQGNSLYGVQSYATHPLIDLNAAFNTQSKLAAQLTAGAHASAQDAADLTSLAYQLESNRQTQIAAFNAIQSVAQGPAPTPAAVSMVFRASTLPNGQVDIQPVQPGSVSASSVDATGLGVLQAKCAACHSGGNVQGHFDLAKMAQLSQSNWDDIADRIALPVDDPKHMPKGKTGEGYGPGEALSRKEINAIEDLAWGTK